MGGKFINIASFGKLLFFKPEKAENGYRNRKKGKRGERGGYHYSMDVRLQKSTICISYKHN